MECSQILIDSHERLLFDEGKFTWIPSSMELPETFHQTNNLSSDSPSTSREEQDLPSQFHSGDCERYCWICFETESESPLATWIQPCNCRGTTKWVHENCLHRWIDEKQNGNLFKTVACQQCQTEYLIVLPTLGFFADLLDSFEHTTKKLSPFCSATFVVISIYWTAVTYGACTLLQIIGPEKGMALIECGSPSIILFGLPSIPIILIASKLIEWEESVLRIIHKQRNIIRKFPFLRFICPYDENSDENEDIPPNSVEMPENDVLTPTLSFCSALLFPSIATVVGKVMFNSVENTFHRALLGGLSYLAVKSVLKIYLKQQQIKQKINRKVVDYTDENIRNFCMAQDDSEYYFIDESDVIF